MSHYEKMSIIVIRIIACCVSVFGVLGIAYGLVVIRFDREASGVYFYSSLVYVLAGVVLFVLSRPLAAFAVKGLPKD